MSAVTDVAAYLAAQGHGTVGTSIFRNGSLADYDDEAGTYDSVVLVSQVGGMPTIQSFASRVSTRPGIQVFIRNTDMAAASTLAHAIYDTMDGASHVTMNSVVYLNVRADSPPIDLGRDANRRSVWVVNLSCMEQG